MNLLFDLETDGLLEEVTKIHSLVIYDLDNEKLYSCADQPGYMKIEDGLTLLQKADVLWGQNIIDYDQQVLNKLYPHLEIHLKKPMDTLNLSRLIYPEILTYDYSLWKDIPPKLKGRHSLESWGYRLGTHKDSFGKTTDWKNWSKEMQDYCEQDVLLNVKVKEHLLAQNPSQESVEIEMRFQQIITQQQLNGCPFDKEKAIELYNQLSKRSSEIEAELKTMIPDQVIETVFIPKVNNLAKGYYKGVPITKKQVIPFNPGSRQQIEEFFKKKYNWKPTVLTEKGNTTIDSDVLASVDFPEAKLLSEYFDISKVMGRLSGSKAAWLNNVRGNPPRCYGSQITNGTPTARCTHRVIANVPKASSFMGKELRSLFMTGLPGYKAVGADASRLELVTFAHYLAAYDGGEYAREVESGDIHTKNQIAAGLETRDDAKRFVYAVLYGGGEKAVGEIIKPNEGEAAQRIAGKRARDSFCRAIPAYTQLVKDVQYAAKQRGFLKGLDGRKIPVRSAHSALNALLQSAGAIIFKKANIIFWDKMEARGIPLGDERVQQAVQMHDEVQLMAKEDIAEIVRSTAIDSIREAGLHFKLNCTLDADAKIGDNWYETH